MIWSLNNVDKVELKWKDTTIVLEMNDEVMDTFYIINGTREEYSGFMEQILKTTRSLHMAKTSVWGKNLRKHPDVFLGTTELNIVLFRELAKELFWNPENCLYQGS